MIHFDVNFDIVRYLYKDETAAVTRANVLEVLYAAHKYDIGALKAHCETAASQGLTAELVFTTIQEVSFTEPISQSRPDTGQIDIFSGLNRARRSFVHHCVVFYRLICSKRIP